MKPCLKQVKWGCSDVSERNRCIVAGVRQRVLVLLAGLLFCLTLTNAFASTVEPESAMRIRSNALNAPAEDSPWESVALPDNRRAALVRVEQDAWWYRVDFDVEIASPDTKAWAAYFPYLRDGGRVFLNGHLIEQITESSATLRVKWERPHLVTLPGDLLREGRNQLMVRTHPWLDVSFPRLSFGPAVELRRVHEWRSFLVLTLPQVTIVCCLLVAVFTLLIWAKRPTEQIYGFFGLTVLFWGLRTLTFVIEVVPLEYWLFWRSVYHTTTGGFVALLAVFCARFADLNLPRWLWKSLFTYWLICPVAMLIFGAAADLWMLRIWIGGFIPVALAAAGMIFLAAWRQRSSTSYALLFALIVAVLTGVHDYLLIVGRLGMIFPLWGGQRMFLMHHGANLMLMVMGGILAQRFVHVLWALETVNNSLETRIAQREAQLEAQYQRAHALERERATVEERRRIMQDMHDGLGSELFQALSRTERGALTQIEQADVLRSCIDEMRLALEALGATDGSFMDALADFRFRWDRHLQAVAIGSTWRFPGDAAAIRFPPPTTLQILRIVQEALTNVLKHAQADEIRVTVEILDGELRISVEDYGHGMDLEAPERGRGMGNMRRRAELLGAQLTVQSAPGRTCVELCAPLTHNDG